jgi:tetratricopeptide (TPR) repeat protein
MRHSIYKLVLLATTIGFFIGCAAPNNDSTAGASKSSEASAAAKLPVTTSSEDARKEFLEGRDLTERLLIQNSIEHFDKAISLDPNFASAELARANASPTAKEFFDHLNKAVSLASKASEGERLQIQAAEAGANGDVPKQKSYLDKLVAAYPNDERAQFQMGGYYFGQQDYQQAITHYKKATELNSKYSPVYNIMGYAYRQSGDFANAEQAFKKYIELIPNDPNPYDSYAELLLKMGKYEDAIVQYRKALAIDPKFVNSYFAISAAKTYLGKPDEAAAELQKITDGARNDGERRTALFAQTVVDVDGGKLDKAVSDMDKQYALGEKINDVAAMTGDLATKGAILVEMGKYDDAKAQFDRLLKMTKESSLSPEIKENTERFHHYNLATVALGKKDIATAKTEADLFRKGAEASKNPAQMRFSHSLAGQIALAEKQFDTAIAEFSQANMQNPQDLYWLSLAYQGKGDKAKASEYAGKAANFNSLPLLNYAFVRTKAQAMARG